MTALYSLALVSEYRVWKTDLGEKTINSSS